MSDLTIRPDLTDFSWEQMSQEKYVVTGDAKSLVSFECSVSLHTFCFRYCHRFTYRLLSSDVGTLRYCTPEILRSIVFLLCLRQSVSGDRVDRVT